jgi:hypothetical protein
MSTQKKAFKPDFNHRLHGLSQGAEEFTISDLTETISLMCERANAMIMAIQTQFADGVGALGDKANFAALDAVSHEIADIQAIISAFEKTADA